MPHFYDYVVNCPSGQLEHRSKIINNLLQITDAKWKLECNENPPFATSVVQKGCGVTFEIGTQIHAGVSSGMHIDESGWDHRVTLFMMKVPLRCKEKISRMRSETSEMPWGLFTPVTASQIQEAQAMVQNYHIVAFADGYYLVLIEDDICTYMKMNGSKNGFIVDYSEENVIPPSAIACKGNLNDKCLSDDMIDSFCECFFVQLKSKGDRRVALGYLNNLLSSRQSRLLLG